MNVVQIMLKRIRKYKLVAVMMSVLMFTATIGFSIDMHFCQGNFKNLSFIGNANTCHDVAKKLPDDHCAKLQTTCHKVDPLSSKSVDTKGCCDNKTVSVQLEDDYVASNFAVDKVNQDYFLLAFILTQINAENNSVNSTPYRNYKPPLIEKDIPVFFQTFLI